MSDQAVLKVGGRVFEGWKRASISRSLETGSGDFELSVTERWSGQAEPWPIAAGDACQVSIGGATVIDGWIDDVEPSFTPDSHGFMVRGRDKTADLVDCSAIHKPGSWKDRTLQQIASELAKPFGLKVSIETDTGAKFRRFALQQGETVFEAIERMARLRGVLVGSTASGDVRIWRPTLKAAGYTLEAGVNMLAARVEHSTRDRFSAYLLKGQAAGDDFSSGAVAAHGKAEASDPGVKRYRPLLIVAEDQGAGGSLAARAKWEASVRAGRAQQVTVTVQGWTSPAGALYQLDTLVRIKAPILQVDQDLLLSTVRFEAGDRGTVTELTFCRPEAFSIEPVAKAAESSALASGRRRAA